MTELGAMMRRNTHSIAKTKACCGDLFAAGLDVLMNILSGRKRE